MKKRALVYCEHQFGSMDGKTANGLVRESGIYEIMGVIDSSKAGLDAGEVLDQKKMASQFLKIYPTHLINLVKSRNTLFLGLHRLTHF